jgi:hypothetical protein
LVAATPAKEGLIEGSTYHNRNKGGFKMDHYKLFIDGDFVEAQNGATFESIDPGTGLPMATVA